MKIYGAAMLPLLPMGKLVPFPGTVATVSIGRPGSIKLIEESLSKSKIGDLYTSVKHSGGTPLSARGGS